MTTAKQSVHWKELDILRGLAVVLMIVNHVGVKVLAPEQASTGWTAALLFIGSFAPVLFFFVTGVGYGIQSTQKKKVSRWATICSKVAILFLADLLMHWSAGRLLGLDFLGFIGFSVLVLEFIRQSRSPVTFCLIGVFLTSCLRYALGPALQSIGYNPHGGLTDWLIGTSGIPGISYPFSPWIAYPLIGFIVGVFAVRQQGFIEKFPLRAVASLVLLGVPPLSVGLILAGRGAPFFRWGTVSLGFYVVSFTALCLGLALSVVLYRRTKLKAIQNALSLKGIASLAVVPIHYFLIEFIVSIGWKNVDLANFGLLTILLLVASILLARSVENLSQKIHKISKQKQLFFGLILLLLLASGVTLAYANENTFLVMFSRTLGQLILCLMLAAR